MSFNKKTIKDLDINGKRILMRADYNVPVKDGQITDDYRIKKSLPTIEYILSQGASLVIISHLGRPTGPGDRASSMAPVAKRLGKLLDKRVLFAADCVGEAASAAAANLKNGEVLVFENVRFHPEEEENNSEFAKKIVEASQAEIFVQDGFGVVHRAHASTEAITKFLPSVAGLLLEKEVETISTVMTNPKRPLVAVVGGAKISDKIEILNILIDLADCVAIAGAMANNFLLAQGIAVGKSLVETEAVATAKHILKRAKTAQKERRFNFMLPVDAVVSTSIDGKAKTRVVDIDSNSLADIEAYPKKPLKSSTNIDDNEMILDIGPMSAFQIAGAIKMAQTVIWNGTAGVTETKGIAGRADPFSHATEIIVEAMIGESNLHTNKPFTLVGGGDTVGYVENAGLVDDFSHVSTGGGASLELMSGHKLPGVEALEDK